MLFDEAHFPFAHQSKHSPPQYTFLVDYPPSPLLHLSGPATEQPQPTNPNPTPSPTGPASSPADITPAQIPHFSSPHPYLVSGPPPQSIPPTSPTHHTPARHACDGSTLSPSGPTSSPSPPTPPSPLGMVTRSKYGIFKPNSKYTSQALSVFFSYFQKSHPCPS